MDNLNQTPIVSTATAADRPRQRWPLLVAPVWLLATLVGTWFLWRYANVPGERASAPTRWPSDARVELSPQGDTLVMFAHPHCPCTRASVAELERIISKCQGAVTPWIVFYKPSHTDDGWERTDLWRTAAAIPGAHVISDVDGAEARHFHVATSGQTLLYDAEGRLLFSGGITGARGHEGDNLGKTAVIDLLNTGDSSCRSTSAFGCPIIPSTATP
jgi:hypothetical protein